MNLRREMMLKATILLSGLSLIFTAALLTYYRYVSYRDRILGTESLSQTSTLILLVSLMVILTGVNFVYFYYRTRKIYPKIARGLPICFIVISATLLLFHKNLFGYSLSEKGLILIFLLFLVGWLLLNAVAHFVISRRSSESNS